MINLINERKSNIELLRIFSMILIVFHHYATHGGVYWNVNDGMNEWIATAMISYGKIGVDIFMIICGYFMVEQQFTWKKLLKLEVPVWFYSVLFGILACFVFEDDLGIENVLYFLFPVLSNQGDQYWFVPCYMATILLSPAINKVIKSLNYKTFKRVLLVAVLLVSVIPTVFRVTPIFDGNISLFVLLYVIGAFLRLNQDILHKTRMWCSVLLLFIISAAMIVGTVLLKSVSADCLWVGGSIFSISISVLLFVIFAKFPMGYNKWINGIAATTFGIYLIHDNLYVRNHLWTQWLHCQEYYSSEKLWLHGLCCVVIVFVGCMIIEAVRQVLFSRIRKMVLSGKKLRRWYPFGS